MARDAAHDELCPVDGCTKTIVSIPKGMCRTHAERVARHGDPHAFTAYADRNMARGPANSKWVGDQASYASVHQRLGRTRGPAKSHACADCAAPAQQWSYDHSDPNELTAAEGAYSLDPEHYVPKCVRCHKRADLARKPVTLTAPLDPDVVRLLHAQGVRAAAIARRLGVSSNTVRRAFVRLGLPAFPIGRPPAGDAA